MKKLSFFFMALAMSAMAMAADAKLTYDFSSDQNPWKLPTEYVIGANTYTMDTLSVVINGAGYLEKGTQKGGAKFQSGTKGCGIIMGKKDSYIELPALKFDVSNIKVYGIEGGSSAVEFNVFVADTAVSTGVKSCLVTQNFDIVKAAQAKGTIYRIVVTSAHNIQISKIEVYEVVAGSPDAPTFSVAGGTYIEAQTVELACATDGAVISYSYDNENFDNYSTPLNISETTTIYAKSTKSGISSKVVSATYTIIATQGKGTKEDPYTVADVIKLGNPGFKNAWVTGTIVGTYVNNKPAPGIPSSTKSNLALATDVDTIPVQLPSGDIQKDLNLVDHNEYLDRTITVKGELASYFSTTGVKNTSEYELGAATKMDALLENKSAAKKMMLNGQMVIIRDGKMFNALGAEL